MIWWWWWYPLPFLAFDSLFRSIDSFQPYRAFGSILFSFERNMHSSLHTRIYCSMKFSKFPNFFLKISSNQGFGIRSTELIASISNVILRTNINPSIPFTFVFYLFIYLVFFFFGFFHQNLLDNSNYFTMAIMISK